MAFSHLTLERHARCGSLVVFLIALIAVVSRGGRGGKGLLDFLCIHVWIDLLEDVRGHAPFVLQILLTHDVMSQHLHLDLRARGGGDGMQREMSGQSETNYHWQESLWGKGVDRSAQNEEDLGVCEKLQVTSDRAVGEEHDAPGGGDEGSQSPARHGG